MSSPAAPQFEPVAIIGMACRLPDGIRSRAALWHALMRGADLVTEIPSWRFDVPGFYDPQPSKAGHTYCRFGAFLDDIDKFDPTFFGINLTEASFMDPQQRLVLASSWHALEDAGIAIDDLRGSDTGVYVGAMNHDYAELGACILGGASNLAERVTGPYSGPGGAHSVTSGRVANILDLQGPAVTIDTACSSGLVAVHLACQALRLRDINLAIVSGVNAILSPFNYVFRAQALMLSPTGRCRVFSADADGYVPAEGCCSVVLKRLSDAERDGDRVHAVVAATATNQDGRTASLTAPSLEAQKTLLTRCIALAGITPGAVQVVEAHGTGTARGDPIEAAAIGEALGKPGSAERNGPLLVGSLKANMGHLESAAGTAGLVKLVIAMKQGQLPPQLHLREINPKIDLRALDLCIPRETMPWPSAERASERWAVINSFGWSGTNACAVVRGPPLRPSATRADQAAVPASGPHLLCLSAPTRASLRALAAAVVDKLSPEHEDSASLPDLCHAAQTCRGQLPVRAAVVLENASEAEAKLYPIRGIASGRPPRVGFVFAGQASHYANMGLPASERFAFFSEVIDRCDAAAHDIVGRRLRDIFGSADLLNETRYAQPAIFALSLALCAVWRALGITPVTVLGHSLGELSAATAAGMLSLEDGARIAAERGRLVQKQGPRGAMVAVLATEQALRAALADMGADAAPGKVVLAAYNAPRSHVLAGPSDAMATVIAALTARGFRCHALASKWAFHTAPLAALAAPLGACVSGIRMAATETVFVSACRGRALSANEAACAEYWGEQLVEPVRFSQGLAAMVETGCDVLVEIGPGSSLSALVGRHEGLPPCYPSLNPAAPVQRLLETVGILYESGASIRWEGLARPGPDKTSRQPDAMPLTPTVDRLCWIEGLDGHAVRPPKSKTPLFCDAALVAMQEHRVGDEQWVPAAAMLLAMEQAAEQYFARTSGNDSSYAAAAVTLTDVVFNAPLFLSQAHEATLRLSPATDGSDAVEIAIAPAGDGGAVARGQARLASVRDSEACRVDGLPERSGEVVDGDQLYARIAGRGLHLGPTFQRIASLERSCRPKEGWLILRPRDGLLPSNVGAEPFVQRMCDLDAALHGLAECRRGLFVPASVTSYFRFRTTGGDEPKRAPASVFYHLRHEQKERGEDLRTLLAQVWLLDEDGTATARIAATLRFADRDSAAGSHLYRIPRWVPEQKLSKVRPSDDAARQTLIVTGRHASQEETTEYAVASRLCAALGGGASVSGDGTDAVAGTHLVDLRPAALGRAEPNDTAARLDEALRWLQQAAQRTDDVRITWVTQGAVETDASGPHAENPLQSALLALGKVAVRELPARITGCIDLPSQPTEDDLALCAELLNGSGNGAAVSIREGQARVLSLEVPAGGLRPHGAAMTTDTNGVDGQRDRAAGAPAPVPARVLITGGTGGLGLMLAEGLAKRGTATLVLVSRRAPSDAVRARTAAWKKLGARALTVQADVGGDADRLTQTLVATSKTHGPFDAVVHAAGCLDDRSIMDQDATSMKRVLSPKTRGTAALCDIFATALCPRRDRPPLRVFLFSSINALACGRHQANYAAANAWMEAYANTWRRRVPNCAVTTFTLGPFADVGMAATMTEAASQVIEANGLRFIPPDKGLAAMLGVAARWPMPANVAIVDLVAPHASVAATLPSFLRRMFPDPETHEPSPARKGNNGPAGTVGPATDSADQIEIRNKLASMSRSARCEALTDVLLRSVRALLSMADDEPLSLDRTLFELGLDSYSAVELAGGLNAALGTQLHGAWVFEYPTVAEQAEYLADLMCP